MSEKMKFVYTHCGDLQYGVVESAILCNNCGKALKVPIPEPPQPSPLREQIGVIVNHWGCYDRHIPQMPDLNDLLVGLIMQAVQQWYGGIIEGMPTDEIGVNTLLMCSLIIRER